MPDIITHNRYARDVLSLLPDEIRQSVSLGIYDLASVGPDLWFSYSFWNKHGQRNLPQRGSIMHRQDTGRFLITLLNISKNAEAEARKELFSYFAGFICHYTLDKEAHPYIIYRSGDYTGTAETLPYRGNHMYLERAIDTETFKAWPDAGKNPILEKILAMKRLPECIRRDYDRLFAETYGWENAFEDMNLCIRHQRLFYRLAWDSHGILLPILRMVGNGKSATDLTACSYFGKDRHELDVLNTDHREWKHPRDASIVSRESFEDLRRKAIEEAVSIILKAWRYLCGEDCGIADAIGNFSYESGFDCNDSRNNATLICDPLPLKNDK